MSLVQSHLLAVHLHQPMDDELVCLPHAASKHGSEYGGVESPLERVVCHLHVRRHWRCPCLLLGICPHSSSSSLLGAVVSRQVFVVHGHHGGQIPLELALPLFLLDVFAVVCPCARLGSPFLLEVRLGGDVLCS